jgi:hypothetical protein
MKRKTKTQSTETGAHRMHPPAGRSRRNSGQTEGQYARDAKGRKGQYGGAGDSPLIKK